MKEKITEQNFKHTFTEQQRDALWQYFMDHSRIQKNGFYGIMFYILDEDDFYRRLFARFTGDYARYNKLEKAERMTMIAFNIQKRMSQRVSDVCKRIDTSGNLFEKLILYINRKTKNYLFK